MIGEEIQIPIIEDSSPILKAMIANCLCQLCKGLLDSPQMLRCKHMLCQRCINRLNRRSNGKFGPLCPADGCHEKIDKSKVLSDSTTETLVSVLRIVKSNLCQETGCWRKPEICCPDCQKLSCREHHQKCIMNLKKLCGSACDSAEEFVANCSWDDKLILVGNAEESLNSLKQELVSKLDDKIGICMLQLEQQKLYARKEMDLSQPLLNDVKAKLAILKQLKATDNFSAMLAAQQQLRQVLSQAKLLHPPMELALPPPPEECLRGLKGVLARVRVDSIVWPYGSGQGSVKLCGLLRTRPLQPWDMALLTNIKDVFVTSDSALTREFKAGCRTPPGSCLLLINFKGFPTKRLHVYDCDLSELATVSLDLKSGEMPGKFAICNKRQIILASEPSQHCVFTFSLAGELLQRFGKRGSEPGCFNEPMSLFPCEDTLYVVDSENKRVQLFNMSADYAYVDKLEHPQFTGHVHSVHVGSECIVVSDRERRAIYAFDRETRQPIADVPLQGQPFDFASDQYGNVFVSVADDRTVRIFNHSLAVPLYTVRVHKSSAGKATVIPGTKPGGGGGRAGASGPSESGGGGGGGNKSSESSSVGEGEDEPLRKLLTRRLGGASGSGRRPQIHGLAFLPERKRLFVADTFRCSVLVFDLLTA